MAGGEGAARSSRIGARTAITSLCCESSTVPEPLVCCAQVVRPEKKPKPEPKHVVKMPGAGRGNNPASHVNLKPRAKKEQSENEEQPQQHARAARLRGGRRPAARRGPRVAAAAMHAWRIAARGAARIVACRWAATAE